MEQVEPDTTQSIEALIAVLRSQRIDDERVLRALRVVPRERFVPKDQRRVAWTNSALPIGQGQTISQPYIVALMTSALRISGGEKTLEIGTGSGYQTAVLAALGAEVFTIERHPELASRAASILGDLGYMAVHFRTGDGSRGWPEEQPFDRIIVTAAAPGVPEVLVMQLHEADGRMVIPVGNPTDQELVLLERHGADSVQRSLGPVRFVPLIGEGGWADDTQDHSALLP